MATGAAAASSLERVRALSPLTQCITNYVSMDIMANTLLAAGCSPAMVHSAEEVEPFVSISSALSINIGTLSPQWVEGMRLAATKANSLGKPWVLDPVGVGATPYRTGVAVTIAQLKPTVIRGNASEILALANHSEAVAGTTRGVDSTHSSSDALEAGNSLAKSIGCVVAISGAVDYITDGTRVVEVHNSEPLLQKITATGCSVTSLIAAYVAASESEPIYATAHALAIFCLAAERASVHCKGPGSLRVGLLDELHNITSADVQAGVKIIQAS
eukprot:comp21206_c0_seq1/m.28823 comp21206_c0_seq1/g.28823  ORF comp21206_c0_seq1/g.28823 comp21206_c0_seq1/m.28823 type:complete len:273 (-) comp21206_c0_seq1:376-1194(-)